MKDPDIALLAIIGFFTAVCVIGTIAYTYENVGLGATILLVLAFIVGFAVAFFLNAPSNRNSEKSPQ